MHDAAVERLAKIISDPQKSNKGSGGKRFRQDKPQLHIHLGLAEGWFSLILLAAVVYSTIWCVQVVGWVAHLNVLSLTTAFGLLGGVIAAKQDRFSRFSVHVIAVSFGILLAVWQTAGAFYRGDWMAFLAGMRSWFIVVTRGGTGNDDAIFLLFILALGFILAYTSAWLVYRTRNPWLMIVANAVVLLINLNNVVDTGYIVFLVIFLFSSLLLLLRFNLYESMKRWKKQGLRYADDIGWDVMQAGALISIGLLIFSWLLPSGYTDFLASQLWNTSGNPWLQVENTWNRVISVNAGSNPSNHGSFRDTLVMAGNPNLNRDIVFTMQTSGGPQYLAALSLDNYTARDWTTVATNTLPLKPKEAFPSEALLTHTVEQKITVMNPPTVQEPYIFGASSITSTDLPASLMESQATGEVIGWLKRGGGLAPGTTYTVVSAVSSADVQTLRGVPFPADAPKFLPPSSDAPVPATYYNPNILQRYLQLPKGLNPEIQQLAQKIVKNANARTMYDQVGALEQYLRTNYKYDTNIRLPAGEEGVSWFLFKSEKGYCNYFASAMAIMARELGIPSRVVQGYTSGQYDGKKHQWVIRGIDAHAWTQIYFAGYGWINFEPSASFSQFDRPLNKQASLQDTNNSSTGPGAVLPPNLRNGRLEHGLDPGSSFDSGSGATVEDSQALLRQRIGIVLGGLFFLLIVGVFSFGVWWVRLFQRYGLSTQLYGRVCMLAGWAGLQIRPSQTPYEYIKALAEASPQDARVLERLGDIYVRDRWADPKDKNHPRQSGEIAELPMLWRSLQPRLFLYVLRHPYFLRWVPSRLGNLARSIHRRRRVHRLSAEEEF
ncbi:DUF4129 domain-containing protein [Ktedonosporobacter rubrisoli]|uniref:DUF4129 domain-containing protein n=1 Tax=Ktedonosporobacter rubrisoli TaxID=2509675 RepID=A0A4P6K2K1_KTERU|nr:transglutaminase domain-containing protein [Ktedonosporobacter rubrisoli]QBD82369.1 DUF4129 domain-containing protein [Ktedonosporobacter rubrisoli]